MFGELFGNHRVRDFREVTLPEPVGYAPQTVGWYILFGLAAIFLIYVIVRLWAHRRRNRYRRMALAYLDAMEKAILECSAPAGMLVELPALIKRTALACFPRERVAGLSGDAWLEFLDRTYGGTGFVEGPGRLLPMLAYRSSGEVSTVSEQDAKALVSLARIWMRKHRGDSQRSRQNDAEL
jgi:hypothetical protein